MKVLIKYIYNQTQDAIIEDGSEIMYFGEYSYVELENDRSKEDEFIKKVSDILKNKYGYFSIKVTTISEL